MERLQIIWLIMFFQSCLFSPATIIDLVLSLALTIPHNTEIGIDYGASFGSMSMTFSMLTIPPKIGVSGAATVHDLQGTTAEQNELLARMISFTTLQSSLIDCDDD